MKRTTNYSLPTWEKPDFIQMSDFNDLTHKLDTALKSHDTALGQKAAASALTSEQTTRKNADAALQKSVTALTKNLGAAGHNCRVAFGSYTGTGKVGQSTPNSLACPFYPVLVLVQEVNPNDSIYGPCFFVRPNAKATTRDNGTTSTQLHLTWTDASLSWYSTSGNASSQKNLSGMTYLYVILGYDKTAEES